jgi:hypothetical protein
MSPFEVKERVALVVDFQGGWGEISLETECRLLKSQIFKLKNGEFQTH